MFSTHDKISEKEPDINSIVFLYILTTAMSKVGILNMLSTVDRTIQFRFSGKCLPTLDTGDVRTARAIPTYYTGNRELGTGNRGIH